METWHAAFDAVAGEAVAVDAPNGTVTLAAYLYSGNHAGGEFPLPTNAFFLVLNSR